MCIVHSSSAYYIAFIFSEVFNISSCMLSIKKWLNFNAMTSSSANIVLLKYISLGTLYIFLCPDPSPLIIYLSVPLKFNWKLFGSLTSKAVFWGEPPRERFYYLLIVYFLCRQETLIYIRVDIHDPFYDLPYHTQTFSNATAAVHIFCWERGARRSLQ